MRNNFYQVNREGICVAICVVFAWTSTGVARNMQILLQSGDRIGDDVFIGFEGESAGPVVNNQKDVLFFGNLETGWALMTTNRIVFYENSVTDENMFIDLDDDDEHNDFSMNSRGTVATITDVANENMGLAVFSDQRLIATNGMELSGMLLGRVEEGFVSINDVGDIVYGVQADGMPALAINDEIFVKSGDQIDDLTMTHFGVADINNAGSIAYEFFTEDTSGIAVDDSIVFRRGDTIDDHEPRQLKLLGFNDSGQLLFQAIGDQGTEIILNDQVVLQDGDFIQEMKIQLDVASPPNNRGDFVATVKLDGGESNTYAIATREEIIWSPGDIVDGKETNSLLFPPTMNDSGDVVFAVEFTDGTDGLIMSSVPEPGSLFMVSMAVLWGMLQRRPRP